MVTVSFETNAAEVVGFLRDERRRNIALANALNNTAKAVQRAEREHFRRTFHVRPERATWMERQVAIIKPFARAEEGHLFAKISVGQKPRLLLPMYEHGGEHVSKVGANVAIPTLGAARPDIGSNIIPDLMYKALKIRRRGSGYAGEQGTFLKRNVGVIQRVAQGVTRLLYLFKPATRIDQRLQFERTGRNVAVTQFPIYMHEEVNKAMNFALRSALQSIQSAVDETGD